MLEKAFQQLKNPRTVLITGGTRGIGKATVLAFSSAGYRVAFCYKNSDKLASEIVLNCQSEGQFVCGFKCDISDFTQTKRLYQQIKTVFGNVDTLICNAGISQKKPFLDEYPASFSYLFSQNFDSVANCILAFAPDMISQHNAGRIINLSSVLGNKGCSCESMYSASKGAIESLTKSLALEFAPHNITVNAVAPGFIDTDMNNNLSEEERLEFINRTILKRAGTVEEVANTLLFLASESAGYITGQVININGGL